MDCAKLSEGFLLWILAYFPSISLTVVFILTSLIFIKKLLNDKIVISLLWVVSEYNAWRDGILQCTMMSENNQWMFKQD